MAEAAITVSGVSKDFILPHQKVRSVKSALTGLTRRSKNKTKEVQHALDDISFEVKKGEFFGIVGRNGSGKSTLLKILAQIYQPTTGKVETHGKLVPFIELGVGFNPELTGRENVYLNGAMMGFSEAEIDAVYDDIVKFAELERFMDQKLKNYSSGMQVRLAFSVATRAEADILLVDEVLAVGDADFQRKCFDYFRKLKKNHKTVIFVSHDMSAVREYCDRAILIENSKLVASGTSSQIATMYTRMFVEGAELVSEESGPPKRWGNKKATIQSVSISPKKVKDKKELLTVSVVARSAEKLADLNIGFSISNAAGDIIVGTNTKLLKQKVGAQREGDVVTAVFEVANIFSDGKYDVNAALASHDGDVYDWWDGAARLHSYEEMSSGNPVSPLISVRIQGP